MSIWQSLLAEASDSQLPFVAAWLAACLIPARALARRPLEARTTKFFIGLYGALLPIGALLRAEGAGAYRSAHAAALLCAAQACVLAGCALLFDAILPRLRVTLPRIVQDVAVAALAALTALATASHAGMNLSGLIATSAVLTAVIGFSLQDTLGNVMGGLFLQVDNSISVGDFIKLGELSGKVVEIRWRYTAVETSNGDTAIIPNSALMKTQVLVLGRNARGRKHQRRQLYFNVDFRRQPNQVIDAVAGALVGRKIPHVAEEPAPSVILVDFGDSYARYCVRYWLTDIAADLPTDSLVRSFIFSALKRAGISLAVPASAQFVIENSNERSAAQLREEAEARCAALKRVDLFGCLSEDERAQLADSLHFAPFARGEVITRQGTEAHWLYLITHGSVAVRLAGADGLEKEIARLGAGDFFGEMSLLTGKPRSTTVVALDEVRSFRLGTSSFQDVVARRPELAESFAEILARRRSELVAAREGLDGEASARRLAADRKDLVSSIRRFFDLPLGVRNG